MAEQLVSLGTLEAVELMGLGYPVRIPYDDVRRRYASRLSAIDGVWMLSPKLFTEMMLEVAPMPQNSNAPKPQSPNARMPECPNTPMPQCPNAPVPQCTKAPRPQCANAPTAQ